MMADENDTKPLNGQASATAAPSSITVSLTKAIIANGDEVHSLSFREPTARDIERVGRNPVVIDMLSGEGPKMTFDAKAMSAMMSVLAAVPPSTIGNMSTRDWNSAAWSLAHFFMPEM